MAARRAKLTRLFLVDDHEVVRIGLRRVLDLTPGFRVVGEAATYRDAVKAVRSLEPDLVLMDIRLPDQSGIEAAREILASCRTTKVLFLTSYIDDDTVLAAMLSGAQGYVLKDIKLDMLIEAIKTVAAGQPMLDPRVTKHTMTWLRALSNPEAQPTQTALSPQEQRILPLVAEGKTNKEIAVALTLSDKTVKNYLANIFVKLQITRRSQAAALYAKRSM